MTNTTTNQPATSKDKEALWQQCLANIRERLTGDDLHKYDVWFAGIRCESYNHDTHELVLQVPSRYVYEYAETDGAFVLYAAIHATFGKVNLNYRVAVQEPTFAQIAAYLKQQTGIRQRGPQHIHIANARKRMEDGLRYFLGDKPVQWLKGYNRVVEWLSDNDSRGLLCVGTPGLGKSLICRRVLPVLLANGQQTAVIANASELHDRLDELKQARILIIDDLGKEPRKHYGDTDQSFFELCDNAERTGTLLIITTNLSTTPVSDPRYPDSIQHRYGDEVLSRLRAITHTAVFYGEDLRNPSK